MRGFCKWCSMEVQVNPDGTCFLGHPARVVKVFDAPLDAPLDVPLENDRASERMVDTEAYEPEAHVIEAGQGQAGIVHAGARAAPVELATLAAMTPSLRSRAPFEARPIPHITQDLPGPTDGDSNWEVVAMPVGPQVFRYGGPATELSAAGPEQPDIGGRHDRIGMPDDAGNPDNTQSGAGEALHDASRGGMPRLRVPLLLALAALVAFVAIYALVTLL